MANFKKVLTSAAIFSVAVFALAACAGTRTATGFDIVGEAPEFQETGLTLGQGETHQLGGRIHFNNETTAGVSGALVAWSSSDEAVVSVSGTGLLTAHQATGGVTVEGTYQNITDTITVIINPLAGF